MNDPHIYNTRNHKSWGNHIGIVDWAAGKIEGHLPRRPRVGDHIHFDMQSGKTMDTIVTEVDCMYDPPDQFFATVRHLGYVGEYHQAPELPRTPPPSDELSTVRVSGILPKYPMLALIVLFPLALAAVFVYSLL